MTWSDPSVAAIQVRSRNPGCTPNGMTSMALAWVPFSETNTGCLEVTADAEEGRIWQRSSVLRLYNIEVKHLMGDNRALTYSGKDAVNTRRGCEPLDAEGLAEFEPLDESWSDAGCPVLNTELIWPGAEDGRVQYLDSVFVPNEEGDLVPEFWIRRASERDEAPLLRSTCVPRYRRYKDFKYFKLDYCDGAKTLLSGPAVVYQNGVEVVRLTDGTWMMLLHAWTTIVDEAVLGRSVDELDADDFDHFNSWEPPDCVMTDIVCYFADDADFRTGLRGPFLLVSGRNAVPDARDVPPDDVPSYSRDMCVKPRLMVGMPSAVIGADDYLYVYYAIDWSFNFDDREGDRFNEESIVAGDEEGEEETVEQCPAATVGGDAASHAEGGDDLSRDSYGHYTRAFTRGIGVKRFKMFDLLAYAQLTKYGTTIDPDVWDWFEGMFGTHPGPEGELLGKVRVWVNPYDYEANTVFRPCEQFESALVGCPEGKMVDPAPAWCEAQEMIALYFAFGSCEEEGTGGGIWRCTEVLDSYVYDVKRNILVSMVRGRDFFVSLDWSGPGEFTSTDHVVAGSGDGDFQNPDVIETDFGWRVYTGGGLAGTFGPLGRGPAGEPLSGPSTLHVITGTEQDACG